MSLLTGIMQTNEVEVEGVDKKYVNDKLDLKLTKSGDGMSGQLDMNDNKIIDLKTPTNNTDASTKKYVDDQAALKLDIAGGQMTGPLGLGDGRLWDVGDPTLPTNGANKRYVDTQDTASRTLCVLKAGSTMSGNLVMGSNRITGLGTPSLSSDATTKTYVDTRDNLMLLKAGDTMSGVLNMGSSKITSLATPTVNTDAATKKYVDDQISARPKESNYFVFEFKSTGNDKWKQAENLTGHMFWTNNRDIKFTILSHVFDDDNTLPSKFSLSYWVFYWTKAGVEKQDWSISRIKASKSSVSGTSLQSYPVGRSLTIKDISALTIRYRYLNTGNVGNESALHCLIEYV